MPDIEVSSSPSLHSLDSISKIPPRNDANGIQNQLTTTPIKGRRVRTDIYSSPRFSKSPSINSSGQRVRRFDERLQTRFSGLLNNNNTYSLRHQGIPADQDPKARSDEVSSLKWINLEKLNSLLYSGHSRAIYGDPTCIAPGDILVFGTSKGYILIFDYRQTLIHTIGQNTKATVSGAVTSISISSDSTHVAAGFEKGDVFLWNLNNTQTPFAHIAPLEAVDTSRDGHIKGSSINEIAFIDPKQTILVSTDIHGLAFYHRCSKNLLGPHTHTEKILGRYEDVQVSNAISTIFACSTLPLGSSVEYTDALGLVAIMNARGLFLISTMNVIRTQFKTGRPKAVKDSIGRSGVMSWFPAVLLKDGTKVPAKLAYCFSNILTILEVNCVGETLEFDSSKRWVCDELILGVQWVNHAELAVLTATQQLVFLSQRTMKVGNTVDLLSKHIHISDLYSNYHYPELKFVNSLNSSFKVYKGKFFLVGKYQVYIGLNPNWVNILLALVNKGKYIEAIKTAQNYYLGTIDNLESVSLPFSVDKRKPLVLNYMTDIIKASASHVLTPEFASREGIDAVRIYLETSISALISINAQPVAFEELYEVFENKQETGLFFQGLEPFISSGELKILSPTILKEMVAYYISIGKSDTLEEHICQLDIELLDIDFTISLLKKNCLRDSYIFIWNKLLKDYVTPLLEFIEDLPTGKEDVFKVFGYLAYILTGRQYPTEELIEGPEAENAKLSIYFALFNGSQVTLQNGKLQIDTSTQNDTTFLYIYLLIMLDSKSFLSAMNEILEDPLLNDDEIIQLDGRLKVNRQFIIEVLIEVFTANDFNEKQHLDFAMFLARSYPKFQQFIRLPERLLDDAIERLCSYKGFDEIKEDCELSLQSLLSVYQPSNKTELVEIFEKAGFYEILINLYLNDGKFSKVLETWIKLDKINSIETMDSVLQKCYRSTEKGSNDRSLVNEVVKKYFTSLIEVDTYKIVKILNEYYPSIHKHALELEDTQLKLLYLSSLAELETQGLYKMKKDQRNEYIKALSEFDEVTLLRYVKTLKAYDFDLEECAIVLRQNECIDTLVYLFSYILRYERSLHEVISYMGKLIKKLPKTAWKQDDDDKILIEKQIWKYLHVAIKLANHNEFQTLKAPAELSLNEKMWLQLMGFVVDQLKYCDHEGYSEKAIDLMKRLLQDLFSTLINTRSRITRFDISDDSGIYRQQSSFLKIFTEFLSSTSTTITLLGDVRAVTNEIYLAFSYEKNILTITSKLLDEGIYKNAQMLSEHDHIGWSVKNFECNACGKTIWGRGLNSNAYAAWAKNQYEIVQEDSKENSSEAKNFELVTFSCRHCYHKSCLENLGGTKGDYRCVICDVDQ